MKRYKSTTMPAILVAALLTLLQAGCSAVSEQELFPSDDGRLYINDLPVSAVSAASGVTETVEVVSNVAWTATVDQTWVTVALSGDGSAAGSQRLEGRGRQSLTLTFQGNTTVSDRTVTLTVTPSNTSLGVASVSTVITQRPPTFSVSPLDITGLDAYAPATQTLTIYANNDWSIESKSNWIHPSQTSGTASEGEEIKVELTFDINITGNERTGELVVKCGEQSATVSVSQLKGSFTLSKDYFEFSEEGGTQTIDIGAIGQWSSSVNGLSWITVSPTNGTGTTRGVNLTVAPNNTSEVREGIVTFTSGDSSIPVSIVQSAGMLSVAQSVYNLGREAQSLSVPVTCPGNWTASIQENVNWCQILTAEGNGGGEVSLYIQANTGEERQCVVDVKFGVQTKSILIVQGSAPTPTVSTTVILSTEDKSVTVEADIDCSLRILDSGFVYVEGEDANFSDESKWTIVPCEVIEGKMSCTVRNLEEIKPYWIRGYVKTEYFEVYGRATKFTTTGRLPGEDDHPLP